MLTRTTALALVAALATPAWAERVVAIAPLSSLGAEDKSASTKKLIGEIEQAIGALPGTKVVPAAQVSDAIAKAKKPQLRQCEGDAGCLAELGKLVGASIVVTGEVGGLGGSQVVYLGATDVTTAKELRSTTLALGAKDSADTPSGAAVRLLDPDQYRGNVHFAIDVTGATLYVNGAKQGLSAKSELALPVGMQAIRVTHPQYRDFVRFVDVTYGKTTEVPVGMHQYATIEHDVHAAPVSRDKIEYIDPPLWRRPYVVGPAIGVLAITAGIIAGVIAHKFPPYDNCRRVGDPTKC